MIENYTFSKLSENELYDILNLRNQKQVREASFNKKIISLDDHKLWFSKKIKDDFFNHYVLKHNNKIIGLGYGENYNLENKSCLWGFYVDFNIKSKIKYGSVVKYLLFEKLFSIEKIEKIECQVLKGFEWIKDWHFRWGHELKNFDNNLNCYTLVLEKKNWAKIREKIYDEGFQKKL